MRSETKGSYIHAISIDNALYVFEIGFERQEEACAQK